jgi:hypothetical protein
MKRRDSFIIAMLALNCLSAVCYGQVTPAFLQGTAFLDNTFSASSVSATFPSNPTPGNTIVVACIGDGGSTTLSPTGVTDNQANIYTQLVFQNYVGSGQPTALYVASNITSTGPLTVTCSGLDNVDAIDLFAVEYAGLAKTDVLDTVSESVAETGTYPRSCGVVQTNAQNDLVVAVFNNDATDSLAQITPSDGYVIPLCPGGFQGSCAAQDGSASQLGALITAVASVPGSYSPGFSQGPDGNGSQSICVAVALKAAPQ